MPIRKRCRICYAAVTCLTLGCCGCGKPQAPQSQPAAAPVISRGQVPASTKSPAAELPKKAPVTDEAPRPAAGDVSQHSQDNALGGVPAPEAPAEKDDQTLTPDEYIGLGLPAYDRDWGGADMARAAKILRSFGERKYHQLPRYQSERSGEVFARLASPSNLDLFRNDSLPLGGRLADALNYFQAHNEIFKFYLAAFQNGDVRDCELVELMLN